MLEPQPSRLELKRVSLHVGFELLGILSFLSCLTELIREKQERETRGSILALFHPPFSNTIELKKSQSSAVFWSFIFNLWQFGSERPHLSLEII
ncbi:hypothetical protein L3X38_000615 [Prunus dulcis]|uniref:Uncharacterized protein n=1 Tax=Prunus dulcis TaxID=3755 RepID=A0AAD4WQZ7_PRUDU|nr:hypothetical protein L3X38_000615 [Prunus dulcis]